MKEDKKYRGQIWFCDTRKYITHMAESLAQPEHLISSNHLLVQLSPYSKPKTSHHEKQHHKGICYAGAGYRPSDSFGTDSGQLTGISQCTRLSECESYSDHARWAGISAHHH